MRGDNTGSDKGIRFDRWAILVYCLILAIVFSKIYGDVFDEKLSLGGDNAAYYILGNSIASGHGFTNVHYKDKTPHQHFPVGYPVMIAGISKLFQNDVAVMKKANGLFLFLSIGLLFLMIREVTSNIHIAFVSCLFSIFNYQLLTYSIIMMSEIPFLFFFLLSLWMFIKADFSKPVYTNGYFLFLIICISACYHIRAIGLAILMGLLLNLLWQKKWQYSLTLLLGFIALGLPWYLRNKQLGGSYAKQLIQRNPYRPELGKMELVDWTQRIWTNFERYIARDIPRSLVNVVESYTVQQPISTVEWLTGLCVFGLGIFGLMRVKKLASPIMFTLLGFFGILLIWPDVWLGQRFLIPLIPVMIFLVINGVVQLFHLFVQKLLRGKVSVRAVSISWVIICLCTIKIYANSALTQLNNQAKNSYNKAYQNYFDLANWLKTNSKTKSIVCCRKKNLFHLFSDQYVTSYKYTLSPEEQLEHLKSKHVDYVVLEQLGYSSTKRYLYPTIKKYPEKFKTVAQLKNPDTYLFKFLPELGYNGEWDNGKQHGFGTYTWENGQKYSGYWEFGIKQGRGKVTFLNGYRLEGVWTNDTLNGEAILTTADGQVVEKGFYKNNIKMQVLAN